jgi:type IV fimbrial biogenesis protein FimT
MPTPKRTMRGFTLIEQVTVVAVFVTLVGVGTPALARLFKRSAVQVAEAELVGALHYARATAVQANTRSVLCPSVDGRHCSKGIDWRHGWIVGYDRDHDGQPDGAILTAGGPLPDAVVIRGSGARRVIRFGAEGGAPGSNMSLLICQRGRTMGARRVVLSNTGRVRLGDASAKQAKTCL